MKPRHQAVRPLINRQEPPPPQAQNLPGKESAMTPQPVSDDPQYRRADKLRDKVALISGGDSGIGRATAIAFAKEGADVAIIHLAEEEEDAESLRKIVTGLGRRCLTIPGDVSQETFCKKAVDQTIKEFGKLDILVNNAAEQHLTESVAEIDSKMLKDTFETNFFGYVYLTKAAVEHLKSGAAIINTTSVQAYRPKPQLMAYAATKAAILDFTRSLASELAPKGIRVNAVAPGPVWTPLIPASFSPKEVAEFGKDNPLGRAAQPCELAPAYVFLASEQDSSFIVGQVIHVNGGSAMFS